VNFQELTFALQRFWADNGCIIAQGHDIEVGASTMNPHTFLRALGPEPWKVANLEPCRRPTDGRYGENPNRLQRFSQFQVIMKPSPKNVQEMYLESLKYIGIDPLKHDIRFVEDDWESPTLGAWGLGWEVWIDGLEITQFTYFQQCGGIDLNPISVELTYGMERIAMFLQGVDSVYQLEWDHGVSYGDVYHRDEVDWSRYNLEEADVPMHFDMFDKCEAECERTCKLGLPVPAYDFALKCSHAFNMLDARSAISVTERQHFIARVRRLARMVAEGYVLERNKMDYPLLKHLKDEGLRTKLRSEWNVWAERTEKKIAKKARKLEAGKE